MNFEVIATQPFERKLRKLAKRHKSLVADLTNLIEHLSTNPTLGTALGNDCYKIRLAILSKGRGKSGGARLNTFVRIVKNTVYLLDMYDKSDQASISDKELRILMATLTEK